MEMLYGKSINRVHNKVYQVETCEQVPILPLKLSENKVYSVEAFDIDRLKEHIEADRVLLQKMIDLKYSVKSTKKGGKEKNKK